MLGHLFHGFSDPMAASHHSDEVHIGLLIAGSGMRSRCILHKQTETLEREECSKRSFMNSLCQYLLSFRWKDHGQCPGRHAVAHWCTLLWPTLKFDGHPVPTGPFGIEPREPKSANGLRQSRRRETGDQFENKWLESPKNAMIRSTNFGRQAVG
jgi:hypothetical protein